MSNGARFFPSGTIEELFPTGREAFDVVAAGDKHAVRFRFLVDKAWGKIDLCIQIDDETSLKDVEAIWPVVFKWRERINQDPGHNPFVGSDGAYFRLWQDHEAGASYGKLAERINAQIVSYLLGTDEFMNATDERGELLRPREEIAELGRGFALNVMRLMQPRPKTPHEVTIDDALREIEAGRPPFVGPESPITYGDVASRIHYFERRWRNRLSSTKKPR